MTSTNDGKDVKYNRISGQKAKTYYIELYKSLDGRLSAELPLEVRSSHLCEAWRRVHTLCQHSTASTHEHLVNWLQRHTAQTILQSEWPKNQDKHRELVAAVDCFVNDCHNAIARNGSSAEWEVGLLQRAAWLKTVIPDPWGNAVLKAVLGLPDPGQESPRTEGPSDDEVLEWLKEERGMFFLTRLRQLGMSKGNDLAKVALKLAACVMDRVRACTTLVPDHELLPRCYKENQDKCKKDKTFADILVNDAGFTKDLMDLLTDIEFVLLYKDRSKCIALAKQTQLMYGHPLVERLHERPKKSPPIERRLWKNANEVATLIAQVMITRCMVVHNCEGNVLYTLYGCARSLVKLLPAARLPGCAAALAAPAATARHLHVLAYAVHGECKNENKAFVCELYIRAITAGMNELEKLKINGEKEDEARTAEQTLATWFMQLGALLKPSARLTNECALTAFSLHPSHVMYERIRAAPHPLPSPVQTNAHIAKDLQESETETNSEFGSWATDSRSQTNFVKTSETLNLKKIQQLSNILSTAILNEGETLGLSPELCQDLIVLLSGPRLKTLSWDMEKNILLENCRAYMDRTDGGTKAVTTELKYLNLAQDSFMHLPEEEDQDESDIYYGIEKGYEHLVEPPEPEEIWEDAPYDFDKPESPYETDNETPIPIPRRKKKVRSISYSTEEELDPLSTVSTNLKHRSRSNESYKEHTKEHCKDDIKDTKKSEKQKKDRSLSRKKEKEKTNLDNLSDPLIVGDADKKSKPKRERKKKEKQEKKVVKKFKPVTSALSRLVGKRVVMANAVNTQAQIKKAEKADIEFNNQMFITDSHDKTLKHKGEESPDVLFDGLFSMDDLDSHINMSPKNIDNTNPSKVEQIQFSSKEETLNNMMRISPSTNVSNTHSMHNNERFNEPPRPSSATPAYAKSYNETNPPLRHSPSCPQKEVKIGIKRLLEFRKQKSASDLFSESKPVKKSGYHSQSNMDKIAPMKCEVTKTENDSRIQIGCPKSISVPNIPKVYINKQQSEKLNMLKSEINNYIMKQGNGNDFELYPSRNRTLKAEVPLNNKTSYPTPVQSMKPVNTYRNNVEHKVLNTLYQGNAVKITGNVTSKLAQHSNSTTKPNILKKNTETSNLNDFFKDLHRTINAGVSNEDLSSEMPFTSPSVNSYAKQVKPCKKVENAPNTFARLNYLHKNKQGENVSKANHPPIWSNEDKLKYLNETLLSNVKNTVIRKIERPKTVENEVVIKSNSVNTDPTNTSTPKNTVLTNNGHNELRLLLRQQNVTVSRAKTKPNAAVDIYNTSRGITTETLKTYGENISSQYNVQSMCQVNKPNSTENILPFQPDLGSVIKAVEKPTKVNTRHKTIAEGSIGVKRNLKKENKTSKPQDYVSVMKALLSLKTPSRVPNNHGVEYEKASYQNALPCNSVQEQNVKFQSNTSKQAMNSNISKPSNKINKQEEKSVNDKISTKQNMDLTQQKSRHNISTGYMANALIRNNSVVNNTPSVINEPQKQFGHQSIIRKPNQTSIIKKVGKAPEPQLPSGSSKQELNSEIAQIYKGPVTNNIPCSEYDILEELMDDDLRQEIGELSSDEEKSFSSTNVMSKESKVKSDSSKSILRESSRDRGSLATSHANLPVWRRNSQTIPQHQDKKVSNILGGTNPPILKNANGVSKTQNNMFVQDIIKNQARIQNTKPSNVITPFSTSTNVQPNQTQFNSSIISKPCQFLTSDTSRSSYTTQMPMNNKHSEIQTCKQNIVNNLQSTATIYQNTGNIYSAVTQQPPVQNVVLLQPEIIYEPYTAVQVHHIPETVNTNICNMMGKTFVAVDASSRISIFGTPFSTPVPSPLIIGNSMNVPIAQNITRPVISSFDDINTTVQSSDIMGPEACPAECNNQVDYRKDQNVTMNPLSYSVISQSAMTSNINDCPEVGKINVSDSTLNKNSEREILSNSAENCTLISSNRCNDVDTKQVENTVKNLCSSLNEQGLTTDDINVSVCSSDLKSDTREISKVPERSTLSSNNFVNDMDPAKVQDKLTNSRSHCLSGQRESNDVVDKLCHNIDNLNVCPSNENSERRDLTAVREIHSLDLKNEVESSKVQDIVMSSSSHFSSGKPTLSDVVVNHGPKIDHDLCAKNNTKNTVSSIVKETNFFAEKSDSKYSDGFKHETRKDISKVQEERINRKKEAILNRQIQFFINADPIPLTYTPINTIKIQEFKAIEDKANILTDAVTVLKSGPNVSLVPKDTTDLKNNDLFKKEQLENECVSTSLNSDTDVTKNNDKSETIECRNISTKLRSSTIKKIHHKNTVIKNRRKENIVNNSKKLETKQLTRKICRKKKYKRPSKRDKKTPDIGHMLSKPIKDFNVEEPNLQGSDIPVKDSLINNKLEENISETGNGDKCILETLTPQYTDKTADSEFKDIVVNSNQSTFVCEDFPRDIVKEEQHLENVPPDVIKTIVTPSVNLVLGSISCEKINEEFSKNDDSCVSQKIESVAVLNDDSSKNNLKNNVNIDYQKPNKVIVLNDDDPNNKIQKTNKQSIHKEPTQAIKNTLQNVANFNAEKVLSKSPKKLRNKHTVLNETAIIDSYKDQITIVELPVKQNDDPLKRCVSIKLSNGKNFKATVAIKSGRKQNDITKIFDNPEIRYFIMNNLPGNASCLLNIQQFGSAKRDNISTQVIYPQQKHLGTVNLVSDDEEDMAPQAFKTEFGKYNVGNLIDGSFNKHQRRFSQKCIVKLQKCKNYANGSPLTLENTEKNKSCNNTQYVCIKDNDVIPKSVLHNNEQIIEIDDSSNDSINMSGKLSKKYQESLTNNNEDLKKLKNTLLQDLCLDIEERTVKNKLIMMDTLPTNALTELKSNLCNEILPNNKDVCAKNIQQHQINNENTQELSANACKDFKENFCKDIICKSNDLYPKKEDKIDCKVAQKDYKNENNCANNSQVIHINAQSPEILSTNSCRGSTTNISKDILLKNQDSVQNVDKINSETEFLATNVCKEFEDNRHEDITPDNKDSCNEASHFNIDITRSNEKYEKLLSSKRCEVKIKKCDNLVKKYQLLKSAKPCHVLLKRCDNLVRSQNKASDSGCNTEYVHLEREEITWNSNTTSMKQVEESDCALKRCGSMSILNEFNLFDLPLNASTPNNSSIDIVLLEENDQPKENFAICQSDWHITKLKSHNLMRHAQNYSLSDEISTDYDSDHDNNVIGTFIDGDKNTDLQVERVNHHIPSLINLTLTCLTDTTLGKYLKYEEMKMFSLKRKLNRPENTRNNKVFKLCDERYDEKLSDCYINTIDSNIKVNELGLHNKVQDPALENEEKGLCEEQNNRSTNVQNLNDEENAIKDHIILKAVDNNRPLIHHEEDRKYASSDFPIGSRENCKSNQLNSTFSAENAKDSFEFHIEKSTLDINSIEKCLENKNSHNFIDEININKHCVVEKCSDYNINKNDFLSYENQNIILHIGSIPTDETEFSDSSLKINGTELSLTSMDLKVELLKPPESILISEDCTKSNNEILNDLKPSILNAEKENVNVEGSIEKCSVQESKGSLLKQLTPQTDLSNVYKSNSEKSAESTILHTEKQDCADSKSSNYTVQCEIDSEKVNPKNNINIDTSNDLLSVLTKNNCVETIEENLTNQEQNTSKDFCDDNYIYDSRKNKDHIKNEILDKSCKDITLVYEGESKVILKGSIIENPIVGTCYVFPIIHSDILSPNVIDNDDDNDEIALDTCCNKDQTIPNICDSLNEDTDLIVMKPNVTYLKTNFKGNYLTEDPSFIDRSFKRSLKRKFETLQNKSVEKKYRKSKNIDYPKLTLTAMCSNAYSKEFKKLSSYYSSLKFSLSRDYHCMQVEDVHTMLIDWPIKEINEPTPSTHVDGNLFCDKTHTAFSPDPMRQTFAEEISSTYDERETCFDDIKETNFSKGFGERSGRVNQNLKDRGESAKFSAATLPDVKQFQPFLQSVDSCKLNFNETIATREDQIQKINIFYKNIKLRDKVRSFFKENADLLNRTLFENNKKLNTDTIKSKTNCFDDDITNSLFDLSSTVFFEPSRIESVVQVVQLGQLSVSAAAQNPMTCDPRVTQVSDATLPQCSMENGSHDDLQPIKTEYTELTTADISLPSIPDYEHHHHQSHLTASQSPNLPNCNDDITIETEVKIEVLDEFPENIDEQNCYDSNTFSSNTTDSENHFDSNNTKEPIKTEPDVQIVIEPLDNEEQISESYQEQNSRNVSVEKPDQLAHAMNAAGISTSNSIENVGIDLTNALSNNVSLDTGEATLQTSAITAMSLQQAIAQILPPTLNQTIDSENNPQVSVASQILHIVHGKNTLSQLQITENTQQSITHTTNQTPVLQIVQNKNGPTSSNDSPVHNSHSYNGLSLVDSGMSQGGNQFLHLVNTSNQKSNNANQLLKRVNLLTNISNFQGSHEQKMVQFVCKSADPKGIQLNTHQRGMVFRLQPVESTQSGPSQIESQDLTSNTMSRESTAKDPVTSVPPEIKSRSVFEETYAKFVQNCNKAIAEEKSTDQPTALPKFNQAFGKPVYQEDNQKSNEMNGNEPHLSTVDTNLENNDCQSTEHSLHIENIQQLSSSPLLMSKSSNQTSQAHQTLVQQIKQAITPMNIQTMHGGVIYTRQIPVNIGGGQTINLITVPSTERIDDSGQKQKPDGKYVSRGEIEQPIIKIVPQTSSGLNAEVSDDSNNSAGVSNENPQNSQLPPMLTQMRIKLPMLSKNPQMVTGARVVRPSFFQIQRNVIGGTNQPVYQQLVLTTAPTLGHQAVRPTQTQTNREMKVGNENQTSAESQMSSSTLEQLREFDMVLEQVKERSTVQPNGTLTNEFVKTNTSSADTLDSASSSISTQQVLYSVGNQLNVAYVNKKSTIVSTAASTSFARPPDSTDIEESPTSSSQVTTAVVRQTVASEVTNDSQTQHKSTKVSSKSKSRPKTHHPQFKNNFIPPKPSSHQKSVEDEQTTQRILYILAEYKEQVENSPDKDKPAPRRRTNLQASSGGSKRKKSRRHGRDLSPLDDSCRTGGSEDSCGASQGDCNESCHDLNSPQSSPRKVAKKLSFDQDISPSTQLRQQQHRNVLVTDGPTIAVTRAAPGKPATAVLMPANYILPVSMVKSGQQIAIVTNRGPKILTVTGDGGTTNALLLQRLITPAELKPMLARPGVRHVRLPPGALQNLQTLNLNPTPAAQPSQCAPSPAAASSPPQLNEPNRPCSPWTAQEPSEDREEPNSGPEVENPDHTQQPDSEPWNVPQDYSYEETVRTEMDRTVLDAIPDRYSPDMEAQRIFDKMFNIESKKDYIVDPQDGSSRCPYDIDPSDCDDKAYHQVVHRRDGVTNRRLVSAATLRQKFALMEDEMGLQKSLSEECEDLGVGSPSTSDLFPEADLLFSSSPSLEPQQSHIPQPVILNQCTTIPQPDMDDQVATDQLIEQSEDRPMDDHHTGEIDLGLDDVGMVTVSEDGMRASISLDHEEFARSHPNTTFHSEASQDGEVHTVSLEDLKSRHITSTIFQAPATVLVSRPQTTVISQATPDGAGVDHVGYSHAENLLSLSSGSRSRSKGRNRSNGARVIRRVRSNNRRERGSRYQRVEPVVPIAVNDAHMTADDVAMHETIGNEDNPTAPEISSVLLWERHLERINKNKVKANGDGDECCKGIQEESSTTESNGSGAHVRMDSVIKDARGIDRSEESLPPLRTYPPKRTYHHDRYVSELGHTYDRGFEHDGEHVHNHSHARKSDSADGKRRASNRGVVKKDCPCCDDSPSPVKPKKPRFKKPTLDLNSVEQEPRLL